MHLRDAKRIVIKVGSALIVDPIKQQVREQWFSTLIDDIIALIEDNKDVIIVSSGSVALGNHCLGTFDESQETIEEKQAAAACGQPLLIQLYQQNFSKANLNVGQLLLTLDDSEDRRRYLNARNTIDSLLDHGVVPIINENDSVITTEIRVGDNDRLAAKVAQMSGSDVLVLLSDIDGLYDADPNLNPDASFIPEIHIIDEKIEAMAGGSASSVGTGGMLTKVEAAKLATRSGCHMVIAKGDVEHPIATLLEKNHASWFISSSTPISARKDWIRSALKPLGTVTIDNGAEEALAVGSSLLPVGVIAIDGSFDRGDPLAVVNQRGIQLAVGLSAYSAEDAALIIGKQSATISERLGYLGRDELIHRDDLVLL